MNIKNNFFHYRFLIFKSPETGGERVTPAALKKEKTGLSKKIREAISVGTEILSDPDKIIRFTKISLINSKEFKKFKERNPKIQEILKTLLGMAKNSLPSLLKYLNGINIRKGSNLLKIRKKLTGIKEKYRRIMAKIEAKYRGLRTEVEEEMEYQLKLDARRKELNKTVDSKLEPYMKLCPKEQNKEDFLAALKERPKYREALKDINKGSLKDLKDFKVSGYFEFDDSKYSIEPFTRYAKELVDNLKNPPEISSVVYQNGQIDVTGSNLKTLNLAKLQIQKSGFSFSQAMKSNSANFLEGSDPFTAFGDTLDTNFMKSLRKHLDNESSLTPKQKTKIVMDFYSLRSQQPKPFKEMAKKMMLSINYITFKGKSSADGGYENNKRLALKRAETMRDKFCRKYNIPDSFKKGIKCEGSVYGPKEIVHSQAEANKIYAELAEQWNKKIETKGELSGQKPITAKQMRKHVRDFSKGKILHATAPFSNWFHKQFNKMRGVDVFVSSSHDKSNIKINMKEVGKTEKVS